MSRVSKEIFWNYEINFWFNFLVIRPCAASQMNSSIDALTAVLDLYVPEYIRSIEYVPWVFSLLGSALIGLSGILPLIIIPNVEPGKEMKNRKSQWHNFSLFNALKCPNYSSFYHPFSRFLSFIASSSAQNLLKVNYFTWLLWWWRSSEFSNQIHSTSV
jgi:hypothetical protein